MKLVYDWDNSILEEVYQKVRRPLNILPYCSEDLINFGIIFESSFLLILEEELRNYCDKRRR